MKIQIIGFLLMTVFSISVLAQQRVAFVTSVTGNGDLSSWADAGSNVGLAAGDAICQARAAAAGLANAEYFVALLSDSMDDAYCRLTGFTGKKADLCGQASLPTDAGPWVNVRGDNFAEDLPLMLTPNLQVHRSLKYDEFGEIASPSYFTGSLSGGEYDPNRHVCEDWTDGSIGQDTQIVGSSRSSGTGMISVGTKSCSSNSSLACFETVVGESLIQEEPLGSLAFVTEATGTGDLSTWPEANGAIGVEAADEICQTAALNAGLEQADDFIAWISDNTVDAVNRFEYTGPWYRQDGVIVAHDLIELTSGFINAPNNLTDSMNYIGNRVVWTGTDSNGLAIADNCQNWQSTKQLNGHYGTPQRTDLFSSFFNTTCEFSGHLYCFHNIALDLIYENDFESIKVLD